MTHPYIKNIEFEVTPLLDYTPKTDTPREMTQAEVSVVRGLSRIEAIKQHRVWTNSTLAAALRCIRSARGD